MLMYLSAREQQVLNNITTFDAIRSQLEVLPRNLKRTNGQTEIH